jgi:hypothetical protein
MKKIILYIFGITFIIVFIFGFMLSQVKGLSMGGDAFLKLIEKGKIDQAYALCSKGYQASQSLPEFEKMLGDSTLLAYKSVKWTRDEVNATKDHAFLAGVVTTKNGLPLYLEMEFVKEGKMTILASWYINAIRIKRVVNE